jgi:hypothetical protein
MIDANHEGIPDDKAINGWSIALGTSEVVGVLWVVLGFGDFVRW